MKQKKSIAAKRPAKLGAKQAKQNVRASRPFRKRVLLHPFTAMLLLCAGVLIVGTTLRSFAASYSLTATVPAQIPGAPATIISPDSQQHFSAPLARITGNCPAQTYVKLFRNTTFSGVAQCVANTYQVQTSLVAGTNQLNAQVYNLTDQPGPPSAPITVYYDQTTETPPAPPAHVPTTMWVTNVDNKGYKQGSVLRASDNPTVAGWAPPQSQLTVTFHSSPETCLTQADSIGWWTCTLGHPLPAGLHHIDVSAVTPGGQTLTFPTFQITVSQALPNLLAPPPAAEPLLIHTDYHYQVRLGRRANDFDISLAGGTAPYTVTADWGDGTTTTLARSNTSLVTISHVYPTPAGPNKNYTVLVKATDVKGAMALTQLSVVVQGAGIVLLANTTTFSTLLAGLHHWLWLIWPTYTIVVLMAIGYYLGEREEYHRLVAKKHTRRLGKIR